MQPLTNDVYDARRWFVMMPTLPGACCVEKIKRGWPGWQPPPDVAYAKSYKLNWNLFGFSCRSVRVQEVHVKQSDVSLFFFLFFCFILCGVFFFNYECRQTNKIQTTNNNIAPASLWTRFTCVGEHLPHSVKWLEKACIYLSLPLAVWQRWLIDI